MANSPASGVTTGVTRRERATLLVAVLIISICALTYELIVGTLSSYLLGNSVTQFSLTIGVFLFAMGVGAMLSRQIKRHEMRWFIIVEMMVGFFGGTSAVVLYAVFTVEDTLYTTTMLIISLAIGIFVGLEIPLLTRIVAHRESLSTTLADVLSIDYLGALVASLAFPLLLLPVLGVMRTAFLMGLFNLGVASLLMMAFRHQLSRRWRRYLWILTATIMAIMIGGTATSAGIVDFFEQQLYRDRIIYQTQSNYQRIIMTRDGDDIRLFLDGNLQFSSRDEYRYHEMLVHPVMQAARSHETVLVLGGGDGMVARELLKYDDVQEIIVVDLDPVITDLAESHPILRDLNKNAMDDPRVTVVNMDAYNYVQNSDRLFPVVIIDLPDPNNEGLSKLYSQQFYRLLRQRLTPDGVFVTQATSPYFVRHAFWTIVDTIEASDFYTLPLRTHVPSFGEWGFVLAGRAEVPGVAVPRALSLRYLTSPVLETAQVFDPGTARVEGGVNTLDHPILPRFYEEGWRQWN